MIATRVLTGNEQRIAADLRRRAFNRKDLFPYTWTTPPPEAERIHEKGGIAIPAANTVTQILSYQVPANRWFWLTGLVQLYLGGNQGSAVLPGDGNVAWDLDVDIPVGITSLQGYQVHGFSETLTSGGGNFPYGNFQVGLNSPYQLPKPEGIGPEKTLRSKVQVSATASGGRFVSIFDGWLIPLDLFYSEERAVIDGLR